MSWPKISMIRTQKASSFTTAGDLKLTNAEVTGTRLKKRVFDSLRRLDTSGSWGASGSLRGLGGLLKREEWDH